VIQPGQAVEAQAAGLYVPGAGGHVSRAAAIASLERGKAENWLLGGTPKGKILADIVFGLPADPVSPAAYVTLPPPGVHENTKRYLIAIDAPGYEGTLTSDATRIKGLVPVAEIAPTLVALQEGRSPPIRAERGGDLRALDQRLKRIHPDRGWVLTAVALTLLALTLVLPQQAVLAGAAAVAAALLLSWAGATKLWLLIVAIVILTTVLSAVPRRFIPWAVALFFAAFLAVLVFAPDTNSLAVLGPRPDGGGRFYGVTNQVETLLLAPLLAALVVGGRRWLVPLGALALITVGWSEAGADGGGLVVYAVALTVFALRTSRTALTWRRAAVAATAVVMLVAVFIGVDAALGGSSHVTDAVGTGPGSLLGDLGRRLHFSWEVLTKAPHNVFLFILSLAALLWIGTRRPRYASVDAMLVALAVSLLVNDTPVDVIGLGALGCLALLRFESVDSRPMRRGALTAACLVAVLALAGCGDQGVVSPTPNTVVGTVQAEAPGKATFIGQGCGACHTFEPAGPDAEGTIGPDLDKLPEYAKTANKPLAAFVHESIVDPDKYIEKGYPKGVMPKSYATMSPNQLQELVDFLSASQG
jgi:mono/diheme cytochrome c family protein